MHASVDDVFIRQINGKLAVLVVTCKCDVVISLRSAGHVGDVMRLFFVVT